MKSSYMIYCVLFLGATSALMFFVESSVSGEASTHHEGSSETWTTSRKLKEMDYNGVTIEEKGKVSREMHLNDYESMDPVPTGKASISSGAIVHGTPLMPHVSRPHPSSPPSSTPPHPHHETISRPRSL